MKARVSHKLALFAAIVVAACMIVSISGATNEGKQLTLPDVSARLLRLEKKVGDVNQRLTAVEKQLGKRPPEPPNKKSIIEITAPKTRIPVTTYRVLVEGIARVKDLKGYDLHPVLHPVASDKLYVKPPIKAPAPSKDGYSFMFYVPFGTSQQKPTNEHYRIIIVMAKSGTLEPGELAALPAGLTISNAVIVQWLKKTDKTN